MTNYLRQAIERAGQFVFNLRNASYTADGTALSGADVLDVLSNRITDAASTNTSLTTSLLSGSIDVATWREAVAVELRRGTWQSYALGRGGWDQISAADRAAMTARMKDELTYLRDFASAIANGDLSEAEIQARMAMYAEHLRAPYYEGLRQANDNAGMTQERRVLNAAEHCPDCDGYAGEGWQDIGYFPAPGDGSQCLSNCQCEMEFQ